ncbi:MAG: PF20097 family protein, partial [Chloroflexota bacterium]
MSEDNSVCPKCGGEMKKGFTVDSSYGANLVQKWMLGIPRRSLLFGVMVKRSKLIPVRTYRCVNCGYLESYAKGS